MTKDALPIYESYGKYRPPRKTVPVVRALLATVPDEYLLGLAAIVLCSAGSLSRKKRRSRSWSRGKKVFLHAAYGSYRQNWRGEGARIELYVDNIYRRLPSILARLPLLSSLCIAETLFHELGHHIHYTVRPEFKEREDVADQWSKTLMRQAIRKRYWYLVPVLKLARIISPFTNRLIGRRESHSTHHATAANKK
jgi:hypothetical protein